MESLKFRLFASFIGLFLFILVVIFVIPDIPKNSLCNAENRARKLVIDNGVLVKKFRDAPNHNYKTIRYRVNDREMESLVFVLEGSGCYDYLMEGDSIVKTENDLTFKVIRQGRDSLFKLDYECNN